MNWFTFRTPGPVWHPDGDPPSAPPAGDPPAPPPATPPAGDPPSAPPAGDPPPAARAAPVVPAIAKEGDPSAKGAGDWPEDWRERLATGADGKVDEKRLEQLKRLPAPTDLGKTWFDAQAKIRTGKANADEPMPDPAKDAEGAKAWRDARGIPADATGYALPDNLTKLLQDEDKPVLANFYSEAHKAGVPQQYVTPVVGWYLNMLEQQATERNALDKQHGEATEEALRGEWGSDFKANRTIAKRYADETVPGLFEARLPDGRLVGNTPEFVRGLSQLGRLQYGDVSFAGGEQATASENRMAELKKIMDTDIDRWNAEPALRGEYGKLLEAASKRPGRAA